MTKERLFWGGAGAILVAASVLSLWLVRGARFSDAPRTAAARGAGKPTSPVDPRLGQVLELVRKKDNPESWNELVALYERLAADPSALAVRTSVLNVLFSEPATGLRLKRVLEAIAADPTPPSQDPLWPELTRRLAEQWSGDVFSKGRDLMLMEKRERPRRALIDSFADLALADHGGALRIEEAQALLSDFIDIHSQAAPEQRPKIQEAVRKLGGNDPADLLAGRGLSGDKKLDLQVENERNLQAGVDSLIEGQRAQAE